MNQTVPCLDKQHILVTRPTGRENNLCQLISQAGGKPVHYPVIKISPVCVDTNLDEIINNIPLFDIAIFISPTAVSETFSLFPQLSDEMQKGIQVAAIGSKTAKTLKLRNIDVKIENSGHNSESLLRHPAFSQENIHSKKIIIFRGKGGREYLADNLKLRGAHVDYAEVYQRTLPDLPPLTESEQLDAIILSSNEGLHNLMQMQKGNLSIVSVPVIVVSQTAVQTAEKYGFTSIHLAANATDDACFEVIKTLFC